MLSMDTKTLGSSDEFPVEDLSPDPKLLEKVREIMLTLANTISAMKIFPSEHATVLNFVEELAKRTSAFLGAYGKLEIDIEEFVFTFMGKPVYRDELSIKSLPFFFFKDFQSFLNIIYFNIKQIFSLLNKGIIWEVTVACLL